ncbi:porin Omp33-36, partial [Acinetobacter sp.]|uniref:porin Omp33-36 n=1 Tax=Acinetobacter sp. TaxID=472 RepID=UPI003D07936F
MKKLGLATALLLAMTGAQAYQVEVQGQSEYIDTTANDKDFTGGLQGTYYLKDVDSSKGPLAEAAFLNQASNVSVAYNYGELGSDDIDVIAHNYGVKAEAYVPTQVVPVYASASYSHTILDSKNNNATDDQGDRYALELGAFAAPNFLVAVGYTSVADQTALDAFNVMANGVVKSVGETATIGEDQDAITARTKYVGAIDGTNMAIGFESGLVYGDDTAYNLGTTLFVTPKLSVGASYAESSFSGTPDSAWGANVNYFITPAVAVGASYV